MHPSGIWIRRALVVCCLVPSLQGCASVAPYERERLAHRTMAPGYGDTRGEDHVRSVQEGALGGSVQVSSGCGCN